MIPNDIIKIIYLYSSNDQNFLIYVKENNIIPYNKIYINWYELSYNNILSIDFIECFYSKIRWNIISRYKIIDDNILYRYYDKLNWNYVSEYQYLSLDFIENNIDLININKLLINLNYPREYIKKILLVKYGEDKLIKILRSKKRYKKILYDI